MRSGLLSFLQKRKLRLIEVKFLAKVTQLLSQELDLPPADLPLRCAGRVYALGSEDSRTSAQPSLPRTCHSLSADGAKHLGVSATLSPGRAEGDSWLQAHSDCPRAADLWGTSPAPASLSSCSLSTGVHVSTELTSRMTPRVWLGASPTARAGASRGSPGPG